MVEEEDEEAEDEEEEEEEESKVEDEDDKDKEEGDMQQDEGARLISNMQSPTRPVATRFPFIGDGKKSDPFTERNFGFSAAKNSAKSMDFLLNSFPRHSSRRLINSSYS